MIELGGVVVVVDVQYLGKVISGLIYQCIFGCISVKYNNLLI